MGFLCGECQESVRRVARKMTISPYNSAKIRWISFAAIVCVVLGHCLSDNPFVIGIFAQWHVPWFYLLSGFMLGGSLNRHGAKACLVKRTRTLLFPYILWCGIGFLVAKGVHGEIASLDDWLGLSSAFPTGNPHLWYLHCLIVFSFALTFLWLLLSRISDMSRAIIVICVYVLAFGAAICGNIGTLIGTPTSPVYFIMGFAFSQVCAANQSCRLPTTKWISVAAVLFAVLLRALWFVVDWSGSMEQALRFACVLSQIVAIWFAVDWFLKPRFTEKSKIPWLITPVFFVYCFHGFVLKPLSAFTGGGWLFVTTLVISFCVAWSLNRFLSLLYSLLTGRR